MNRPSLDILVVAASDSDARFAARVIEDNADECTLAESVTDALSLLTKSAYDVALVSLSLPRGDGLALVHHIRALHPGVDVLVMARPQEIEETAHAMALGVIGSVLLPLTGDGIMVPVDRARERRVLIRERHRLATEEAEGRRRNATYARCATFVVETDLATVANRILEACASEVAAHAGSVYVPESPFARRFSLAGTLGEAGESIPIALDDEEIASIDATTPIAQRDGGVRVAAVGETELLAVFDLRTDQVLDEGALESLMQIAALGTAALSAARKVEAIARTGIKDPETSAYTFAYFGDVAGREIDRAARHGRRFALLTVGVEGLEAARARLTGSEMTRLRRELTNALLDSVRDSDVVARVEDDELYVLLPETGLLGALACKRRIASRLAVAEGASESLGLDPVVGVAVYPSDGLDLGRLLRASRRRAEASRRGVFRRLGLKGVGFWEAVDRLLGSEDDAGIGRDGTIALHEDLLRAHDGADLARHTAMPASLLPRIGASIAGDALRYGLAGTLYVAGDESLSSAVARVVNEAESPTLRVWSLGSRIGSIDAASRIHLPLDDPRLDDRVVLLALTELGGYAVLGRVVSSGMLLAYHASDLDLVDGLTSALQSNYHLQPEVR